MGDNKTDLKNIEDIIRSILMIEKWYKDIDILELSEFSIEFDALMRRLQIIGEATKRLTDQTKSLDTSIPWKKISGARDVIVHDYDEIDLRTIKIIVDGELPLILPKLQKLRDKIEVEFFTS